MKQQLLIDGKEVTLENVSRKAQEVSFAIDKTVYHFRSSRLPDGSFLLERETAPGVWSRMSGIAIQAKDFKRVQVGGFEAKISEPRAAGASSNNQSELSPRAPMPGLVRQILVKKGDKVKQGDPVAVMEAMKLQTTLVAGGDAVVEAVLVKPGEMITEGAELVKLTAMGKK